MCALESSGDFVQLSEVYDLVMKYHVLKTWSLAGGSTEKWLDRSWGHWFHQHITSLWWFIFTVNLTGFRVNWEMETGPQTAHWQKQFCSDEVKYTSTPAVSLDKTVWAQFLSRRTSAQRLSFCHQPRHFTGRRAKHHCIHNGLYVFAMVISIGPSI